MSADNEIAVDEGKVEMKAFDGRRKELEAQLKTADEAPALLHPEMARIYRTKVIELAEVLQQPEATWRRRRPCAVSLTLSS